MRPVGSLIVLIVAIAVLSYFALSRSPDMLSNYLSKQLGVTVSIDGIKVRQKSITLNQFNIANEPNYSLSKAFSAKTITLNAPIMNYFQDQVVVDEITVDTIYLGIEFDSTTSVQGNWTKLLGHYQKEAKLDATDGRRVLIKKMVFTNIQADLIFRSASGKIQKLPNIGRIELTNISTEGGFPINQLTSSILGQLIKQAFMQYHMDNLLQVLPGKALELFTKPFEGILSQSEAQENADSPLTL